MQKITYTLKEVCELTGLGETSIYALLKTGAIPAKKFGRRTLVMKTDLDAFLSQLQSYPAKKEV